MLQGAVALLSGITAGLFGVGALLAAYMSRTAKDPGEYRANLGFVFVAENVFRLVLYTVTGLITLPVLVEAVKLLPCMVAGFPGRFRPVPPPGPREAFPGDYGDAHALRPGPYPAKHLTPREPLCLKKMGGCRPWWKRSHYAARGPWRRPWASGRFPRRCRLRAP